MASDNKPMDSAEPGFADPATFVPPRDSSEFEALMDRLDAWLQGRGMIGAMRQLAAMAELSYAVGREGRIPKQREPQSGRFEGEDLILHAAAWYDKVYGDALRILRGPGRAVAVIRADTFGLRFPMVVGDGYVRCDLEGYPREQTGDVPRAPDGKPDLNVLDYLEEFPPALAGALDDSERGELVRLFLSFMPVLMKARFLQNHELIAAALADNDTAVHNIVSHPPHFGSAKWAALQAAEKVLKAYEFAKRGSHTYGHKLEDVARAAEAAGLPPVERSWLASIQCEASVRYGSPSVSREEAVTAHYCALRIIGLAADQLHKDRN